MNATGPYPVIGRKPPSIGCAPKLVARDLGAKHGFPRGSTGMLYVRGQPSIAYEIDADSVVIAHTLLGAATTQRLPILPADSGPVREYLGCRCGHRALVLHLRHGLGFVCPTCAARYYESPETAAYGRLLRLQAKLERRLGYAGQRNGSIAPRARKMTDVSRARLNERLDRAYEEFNRITSSALLARLG